MIMIQHSKHVLVSPLHKRETEEGMFWRKFGDQLLQALFISEHVPPTLGLKGTRVKPCPHSPQGIAGTLILCP